MSMHVLGAEALTLSYGDLTVAEDLTLDIPAGVVTAVVGPNACGKSTLLRALARLHAPQHGTVLLDGQDIHRLPTKQVARTLGILPQSPTAPAGLSVAGLVSRGRFPYRGWLRGWTSQDQRALDEALALTELTDLAEREVDELSGGQRQRVWIAMALAQCTDVLLLDEPTTFLDLPHQIEVLDLLAHLRRARGMTIVMVLHDVNLAARYAEHVVAMRDGRIVAQGPATQVVSAPMMGEVFGLDCLVIPDPVTGGPLVVPKVTGRTYPRAEGGPAA